MKNSSSQIVRRCVRKNSAFTLLEVLIALSLAVTLLAAIYAALDLHYKFLEAGREDVKRAQLARAILQKMATDIRCVVYSEEEDATSPEEGEGDTEGEGESGDDDDDVIGLTTDEDNASQQALEDIEVSDPADAFAGGGVGVVGTATSLVLHISRPLRNQMNFDEVEEGETPPIHSDLQSVSYLLAGSGESVLHQMVADQAGDGEGLARMAGDRLAMDTADAQGDLQSMAAHAKIVAPEVNFLQFQYLDGPDVLEEWDSKAFGRLPSAIVIEIGFRPPEETESLLTQKTVSALTEKYRLVVHLPLANPIDASSDY